MLADRRKGGDWQGQGLHELDAANLQILDDVETQQLSMETALEKGEDLGGEDGEEQQQSLQTEGRLGTGGTIWLLKRK